MRINEKKRRGSSSAPQEPNLKDNVSSKKSVRKQVGIEEGYFIFEDFCPTFNISDICGYLHELEQLSEETV